MPQTAERLGLSERTVYVLISSGQLRSIKINSSRRVAVGAIRELVDNASNDGSVMTAKDARDRSLIARQAALTKHSRCDGNEATRRGTGSS